MIRKKFANLLKWKVNENDFTKQFKNKVFTSDSGSLKELNSFFFLISSSFLIKKHESTLDIAISII